MSSHPWLGGAINGSLSAYDATKHYSPRFIRSGAEFVERNIGSPVANTVGSVSRRTGVESRVRRYLGDRRPSDLDTNDNAQKRRRVADPSTEDMDIEKGLRSPSTMEPRSRAESQASFAESLLHMTTTGHRNTRRTAQRWQQAARRVGNKEGRSIGQHSSSSRHQVSAQH
jgi:hypothetical protein